MYLDEYEKLTISQFNGLYKRGLPDECPIDHAICCENCTFTNQGEVSVRPGLTASFALSQDTIRMFEAHTSSSGAVLLTLDSAGNLYQNDVLLYNNASMVDFVALNMFDKVFIAPIELTNTPSANLQVWDGTNPIRDAAGLPPTGVFTAADGAAGNVAVGDYLIAVCYVTNTGFTTPPGPNSGTFAPVTFTAAGAKKIDLSSVPTGGTEVIARQIIITKVNAQIYFFLSEEAGGYIPDNTTTTATLDFFDTDLIISADYLFDLAPSIPTAGYWGALQKYHNRMLFARGVDCDILASNIQSAESFNQVTGIVSLPDEHDGNTAAGLAILRDNLYATKPIGIFAVQDNGLDPVDWPVVLIEGGVGSLMPGISSISGSQVALPSNDVFVFADYAGLILFDGHAVIPTLTYKIDSIWKRINFHDAWRWITTCIDIFNNLIYILVPVDGATVPNLLIVGDFSTGLDWKNIKWTIYTLPYIPSAILISDIGDTYAPGDTQFFIRIAMKDENYIFKLDVDATDDVGAAINAYYQCFLASATTGSINLFRHIRMRAVGSGQLVLLLDAEDFNNADEQTPTPFSLTAAPGKDFDRQINFMREKMSIAFGTGAFLSAPVPGEVFTVERVDLFIKPAKYQIRPA